MDEHINIGVDWGVKEGDETCVVFARRDEDGTVTMIGQLRGEAAEYVARLDGFAKKHWMLYQTYEIKC